MLALCICIIKYFKKQVEIFQPILILKGFPGAQMVKRLSGMWGDPGSTPGLGRSPGEGNDNPLQYSCLKIPWTEEPGSL